MRELPVRKNIRLKNYDYSSPGYYFVTICVKNKHELLGKTNVGAASCRPSPATPNPSIAPSNASPAPSNASPAPSIHLTDHGKIVVSEIEKLSSIYSHVSVDKYVVMPNHVHMIIAVKDSGRPIKDSGRLCGDSGRLCGDSGRLCGDSGRQNAAPTLSQMMNQWKRAVSIRIGFSIWQKSFHDHIIRDEAEYQKIWRYIEKNPAKLADYC